MNRTRRYSIATTVVLGLLFIASSVTKGQQADAIIQADIVIPVIGTAVSAVDFNQDGFRIAIAAGYRARVYDVVTGEMVLAIPDSAETVMMNVSYSPDGRYLLTVRGSGEAKIFDATSGELIHTLAGPLDGPPIRSRYDAVWSHDGTRLYTSAGFDNSIHVWDATSWEYIRSLEGHTDLVRSLSLSADGTRLLSTDDEGWAILWDAISGEILHRIAVDTGYDGALTATYGALTPDGRVIAVTKIAYTDPTWIRLWDVETGASIGSLKTPLTNMYQIRFSDDGAYLLGCSNSKGAYIWRMSDRERMFILSGHAQKVTDVDFSNDGTMVATGSSDGTVRIWSPDFPASVEDPKVVDGVIHNVGLYPNPARESVYLSVRLARTAPISVQLVDILGQCLSISDEQLMSEGDQTIELNVSNIRPGRYCAMVTVGSERIQVPVIIQ